jgi:beta-catenin-like protein 1
MICFLARHRLKQMLLNFEKKINKNQKLRMKYPSEPGKFMESEIELNDQIQELYAIAAYPELYADVVGNGSIPSILGMITHENTDISISTVGLLQELLEADTISEDPDAIVLVEEFVQQQGLELITQNLERLDESNEEDAQGVYNTLSIIENLIDIRQEYASTIGSSTNIFIYLFNRIRKKEMDANKLYASEVLSMLLQSSKANRLIIGELIVKSSMASSSSDECNGIDALCQGIAPYRKRDPQSSDEMVGQWYQ